MRAKSWKCHICGDNISEIGAYVKLSSTRYAHWSCQEEMCLNQGRTEGRQQILQEQADKVKQEQEQAKTDAVLVFDRARRCTKCGIAMMEDRPAALPGVYPTALPASSDTRQCALCIRAEVQARAGARGQQAPTSAAEAIRTAPTRPVDVLKPTEPKPDEPKRDRFGVIEIE